MKTFKITKQEARELWGDDYLKHFTKADTDNVDPNASPRSLLDKLGEFVETMLIADPSKSAGEHLHDLLHTAHGRKLGEHLNNLSKGQPMQVDILKAISIMEDVLMAQVTPQPGQTYAKAFSNRYENDIEYRKQWRDLTDAKHVMALGKGTASLTPTSVETGSSLVADDSGAAVEKLRAMAAKNGRSFETEFSDPKNIKLAAATYTSAHRSTPYFRPGE